MTYFDTSLEAPRIEEQQSTPIIPEDRFIFELIGFEKSPPDQWRKDGGIKWTFRVYDMDGRPFEFKDEHVAELRALTVGAITFPARYFLIAAKGDELLDWRDMVAHYPGARHKVLEGSDHGLADFPDYLDEVLEFAGVLPGQGTAA